MSVFMNNPTQEMNMKKDIVFDFGSVLFNTDRARWYRERFAVTGRSEVEAEYFLTEIYNGKANSRANRGNLNSVLDELAALHPAYTTDIQAFRAETGFMGQVYGMMPGMRETLQDLKAAGHNIYGLTNWPADAFQALKRDYPEVIGLFNAIVVSGELGVGKPDPAIYRAAQIKFGQPELAFGHSDKAKNTLFFDDKFRNVKMAQATVGWKGHVFHSAAQVRALAGLR
jgi:2-haloacid dehalogenase